MRRSEFEPFVPRMPGLIWVLGPWAGDVIGRWVVPRGTTPAARSLVDRRRWARVAKAAGAGRKTACHLGVVSLAEQIGGLG